MKRVYIPFLLLFTLTKVFAQTDIAAEFRRAESLLEQDDALQALAILERIEPLCTPEDTLYNYILWYHTAALTAAESHYRMQERFDSALIYSTRALDKIRAVKLRFDARFAAREYWMIKNVIVSYFGQKQYAEARKFQDELYTARKKKKLPEGIDEYYNFSFFRYGDKNIWGYEWYPELGDPETQGSYSKIVYYVYSTNPDGSDKDQLYRLHVLKFHKTDKSVKIDYVLTKRLETAQNEKSGTLYAYTYTKNIDYARLEADIRQVLAGNYGMDKK